MPNLTCSIDGCERKHAARGWCATHYMRNRKHGSPHANFGPKRTVKGICIADGCELEDRGIHGYCSKHAQRVKKHGDPTIDKRSGRNICTIEDCSGFVEGNGLCHKHWARNKRTGNPHTVRPIPAWDASPHWKGEHASYDAIHWRLRKAKGRASAKACVDCGGEAQEWSYIGNAPDERLGLSGGNLLAYSQDPNYYIPRCVPCHRRHDLCK